MQEKQGRGVEKRPSLLNPLTLSEIGSRIRDRLVTCEVVLPPAEKMKVMLDSVCRQMIRPVPPSTDPEDLRALVEQAAYGVKVEMVPLLAAVAPPVTKTVSKAAPTKPAISGKSVILDGRGQTIKTRANGVQCFDVENDANGANVVSVEIEKAESFCVETNPWFCATFLANEGGFEGGLALIDAFRDFGSLVKDAHASVVRAWVMRSGVRFPAQEGQTVEYCSVSGFKIKTPCVAVFRDLAQGLVNHGQAGAVRINAEQISWVDKSGRPTIIPVTRIPPPDNDGPRYA